MISIAIDGPSASGKSTVAKALSKRIGYTYVDTGALYRAVALAAVRRSVDLNDEAELIRLLRDVQVDVEYSNSQQRTLLNGEDVSDAIRLPEISLATAKVSAFKCVRNHLLDLQRNIAKRHNTVMDGRDIGTVILPDADIKIFLFTDVETRARRRHLELTEKGIEQSYREVLEDMKKRDYRDEHREVSPLKKACDAVVLDNGGMTLDETLESIIQIISERVDVNG